MEQCKNDTLMSMTCPVTGHPCDKFKEFRITEINDGKVTTLNLCRECMPLYLKGRKAEGEKAKIEVAVNDFVQAIGNLLGILAKPSADHTADDPCPKCGATLKDIAGKQKIGCATCYDHFYTQIGAVVARCQGATQHTGKVPKNWTAKTPTIAPVEYITKQKEKMAAAIQSEDYEQAALIRDKLIAFEALRERLDVAVQEQDFEQADLLRNEMSSFVSRD